MEESSKYGERWEAVSLGRCLYGHVKVALALAIPMRAACPRLLDLPSARPSCFFVGLTLINYCGAVMAGGQFYTVLMQQTNKRLATRLQLGKMKEKQKVRAITRYRQREVRDYYSVALT